MNSNYRKLAKNIVDDVGGIQNIESLHHCQTRLRFKLKDDNLADQKKISSYPDVLKVVISGGQFQVIIGMQVADVYDEVIKYMKQTDSTKEDVKPDNDDNLQKNKKK
ncbi:PTS transporter subunit EIIB [Companilactobacillus paralimentarius]|uniref:PTS transporter subunit EIIB n=1 Tax=Companilactobacillus paralimentarius TaxID=83526 RepID=UPI00384C70A9